MSRLDYVTIGIVAVCIAAVIYLIYMTTRLGSSKDPAPIEQTTPFYEDDVADSDTTDWYSDADGTSDWEREEADLDLERDDEPSAETTPPSPRAPVAEPAQPATRPAAPQEYSQATAAGDFMVLAGTFSVAENAQEMVRKLSDLGYTGASVEPFDRGKYSVVLVARFDSFSQASSLEKELKGKGIEAYVKRKR
jgi:hypothetical protein